MGRVPRLVQVHRGVAVIVGARVRLRGKKMAARVLQVLNTPWGIECKLSRNLGKFAWHLAADLEAV
jgi:hypothetical protein